MGIENGKAALDAIGKKIRLKEQIDQPFDENELKDLKIDIKESKEKELPKTLALKLNSKDAGFNCLCELNLGKAYKLTADGKRVKYPNSYKCAMNEKWLKYIVEQIKNATNPVVVVSDIFTRVTTGNNEDTLPYKEQVAYAYFILKDIKDKIILVRGLKEKEIMDNGGPDLMGKLANMLDLKNKLVNSGFHLTFNLNENKNKQISLLHFNEKLSTVRSLAISMQRFANNNPGHDIYFCTTSKTNWYSSGLTTTTDENGKTITKPCWYIAFGGMYEYDKANEKRPKIGPYTLNNDWFKIILDKNNFVRADRVDYRFPHQTKIDSSNYIGSVIADNMAGSYLEMFNHLLDSLNRMTEKLSKTTTKQITTAIHKAKTKVKKKTTKKNIEVVEEKEDTTKTPKEEKTENKGEEKQ